MVLDEALKLHRAGLCVLPIRLDGSKAPASQCLDAKWKWGHWKTTRPPEGLIRHWFVGEYNGLAVVGGAVSGGLCCLDFDNHHDNPEADVFRDWCNLVPSKLLNKLVVYSTPKGGWRVAYRVDNVDEKCKRQWAKLSDTETIIEELANGCLILCPGGHPAAHQTGKPYRYVWRHLGAVQRISDSEHCDLLLYAWQFNRVRPRPRPQPKQVECPLYDLESGTRPGDDFNRRGSWEEVLCPLGWEVCGHSGEQTNWRRPGKSKGLSATTNYKGCDQLYVFSSSTALEAGRCYNKFAALAYLAFDGDFTETTKELARRGYGRAKVEEGKRDGFYTL